MDGETKKLEKGIIVVFFANVLYLVINVLMTFLLPKFLSIDTYAAIKTYNLYVGCAGILALGFTDGMFLKYGGKELENIDRKDLELNIGTYRIFQFIIIFILMVLGFLLKDTIFLAFVFTAISVNMLTYFKMLYQAIGEFKKYSKLTNVTTIMTFVINLILLFIVNTDNYILYLSAYTIINVIVWGASEVFLRNSFKYKFSLFTFSFKEFFKNVKDGFLLMLGNFANIILTSLDRWFVKGLIDNYAFAQYSFACSMETFINVAITPITVTLYNYFCKVKDSIKIKKIRNLIMVFGAGISSSAFIGKLILEIYLTNYKDAITTIFYLFAAQFFYIIIKSIYVNLYKSERKQNKYFFKLTIVIISGVIFNIICYTITHTKDAFAIGTLLSAVLWFIISALDFKWLKYSVKEVAYIVIVAIIFIICGNYFNSIIGMLIYVNTIILTTRVLMNEELKWYINKAKTITKKIIKRKEVV